MSHYILYILYIYILYIYNILYIYKYIIYYIYIYIIYTLYDRITIQYKGTKYKIMKDNTIKNK